MNYDFEEWVKTQNTMMLATTPIKFARMAYKAGQEALLAKGSRVQILPTMELLWFTEAKPHNATLIKDEDLK